MLSYICLGSCTGANLGRNLEANIAEQKGEFREILVGLQNEKPKAISWDAAYRRMMKDSLSIRQSRLQLEEAKKQKTHQWLSLFPQVSSFVNIGSGINDISNLRTQDLNASLMANFNIPNPFQFYASLYAASLQEQNAIWSHELDKRRAYTQLYASFSESAAIDHAEAAYESRLKSLAQIGSGDINKLKTTALEGQSIERRRLYHRLSVNQLLNTPGANWKPVGSLPKISYAGRYKRMAVGEDFGKLALNLQAIQIEGALLRVEQVKFQQWPSVQFGLGAPPLYSSNDNTGGFSSDDLQLFSGASKSFNLVDPIGRKDIQDAKTRLRFTREQLKLRAENEASRILQLLKGYEALITQSGQLEKEMRRLGRQGSLEPDIVIIDLERRSELELQLIETRRQIQQLDLQFLIWDETFWN